jgi:cell division protein FtsW
MSDKRKYDIKLFCVTLFLVALGLVMVTSASQIIAQERYRAPFFFLQRHAIRVALGLCVLIIFMNVPYRLYERFSILILSVSVLMLAAIFVWGSEIRGGNRWLRISLLNLVLQPVEVAKLSLVIFLAARIAELRKKVADFKSGFLPIASVGLGIAVMVALQPNISNAVLIAILTFAMLFIGGCRLKHLLPAAAAAAAAAVPILCRLSHVMERIVAFLDREQNVLGSNWHNEQSLIALGSGFIFGSGPGRGHQKYWFLPDAHTDFIYSIIGEELGAVGTILVLFLFAFIFRRAVKAAQHAPSSFGCLLALGIGISIFTTAIINIAMTLGLIPTAGLPLPFISYGGSSLVTSLAAVGILLNISSEGESGAGESRVESIRKRSRRTYARRLGGTRRSVS